MAHSRFDVTRPQRKKRREQDGVKQMIAQAVQHHLVTDQAVRPGLMPPPDNVATVTAVAISPTETAVRVTFHDDTPKRYFTVIVRESLAKI
jgi:hypothetical protein